MKWVCFAGKDEGEFSEDFRKEKRRIGCGDRSEMEASLRDVKESLRHSLLPFFLSGIGRVKKGRRRVVSGGGNVLELLSGFSLHSLVCWVSRCLLAH